MSKTHQQRTLVYPEHVFDPEDLLNFIELDWFADSWKDLELSRAEDLAALEIVIMCDPTAGDVVPGTGGLRKLRYSPEAWNTGKSHALRVCYVYFEKYGIVLLCLVFRKGELENISAAGKKAVKAAIDRIETQLEKRFRF